MTAMLYKVHSYINWYTPWYLLEKRTIYTAVNVYHIPSADEFSTLWDW